MIKRSTWIYLAILVLAIGAYFIIKYLPPKTIQTPTPTPTVEAYIFTPADGILESLSITDNKGQNVRMQRDLSKVWVVTSPQNMIADQGLAGAAESQVGALKIVTSIQNVGDLNSYKLTVPTYSMDLTFSGGVEHKIEVGGTTPSLSGYYLLLDGNKLFVVSQDGIDSLAKLVTNPPYPPTPTPTETVVGAPTETDTPEVSPTMAGTAPPATATPSASSTPTK
jgi:hypothetical protein